MVLSHLPMILHYHAFIHGIVYPLKYVFFMKRWDIIICTWCWNIFLRYFFLHNLPIIFLIFSDIMLLTHDISFFNQDISLFVHDISLYTDDVSLSTLWYYFIYLWYFFIYTRHFISTVIFFHISMILFRLPMIFLYLTMIFLYLLMIFQIYCNILSYIQDIYYSWYFFIYTRGIISSIHDTCN